MGWKCLIVDDDPLIGDLIKHYCQKSQKFEYCLLAQNGHDGLRILSSDQFDIIFLDYNLPDMKGIEFLELMPRAVKVIMITTEQDFAAESYEYDQIIDFLVKPVKYERFLKALERLHSPERSHYQESEYDCLFVKDGSKLVRLNLNQVMYIKAESNYISFVQESKKIMTLMTMKELEAKLPYFFARVHRSYFVNIHHIKAINVDHVVVEENIIPIGEKYRDELLSRIKHF